MYSGGSFVYDPWELYRRGIITAPNMILAGIVGSGKVVGEVALHAVVAVRSPRLHRVRPQGRAHRRRRSGRRQGHRPRPRPTHPTQPAR
jgi:hypothetical protein